ncbi:hypothetical protein ACFV2Z_27315 [Streptomyces sp. NPDC059688]|uniref:hypothetical protein n=1 Tax=Streptomyces sp. NPDC059688 TaxID=3346906 RepID=UPI00367AAF2B
MEHWAGILMLVLLFTFIVGMFALVFTVSARGRKRDALVEEEYAQLPRIAADRGWTYEGRVQGRIDQYCGVRPFPSRGSNLRAWHYTTGEFRGRSFTYFEYRSMNVASGADAGERKQPTIESVFIVTAPGSGPFVQMLRPRILDTLFDRRATMRMGVPEFDQDFRVVTEDEKFVRDALSHTVVPYLLTEAPSEKSPLQLCGNELFTWYRGALSPRAVDEKLNYLCDVLDRVPAESWTTV